MSWSSNEIHLASRPTGYPDADTWSAVTVELPEPGEGQFVVKVDHISLDPAMRGWLNDVRSYIPPVQIGEAMRAMCTGSVVASRHPDFAVGDAVAGTFGVVEYALSDGTGVTTIDLGVAAAPTWLGALGMTGMTRRSTTRAKTSCDGCARSRPRASTSISTMSAATSSTPPWPTCGAAPASSSAAPSPATTTRPSPPDPSATCRCWCSVRR